MLIFCYILQKLTAYNHFSRYLNVDLWLIALLQHFAKIVIRIVGQSKEERVL